MEVLIVLVAVCPSPYTVGGMSSKKTTDPTSGARELQQEVELLHHITETIWSTLDLGEVLRQIVFTVLQWSGADACFVYLYDEGTRTLQLSASRERTTPPTQDVTLALGEGITGWVAEQKKPVILDADASADPRFKTIRVLEEDTFEAFLSVPILHRDRLIGVINVQRRNTHRHSATEVALIQMIAQQVGGAIVNARFYQEAERRSQHIEALAEISTTVTSAQYLEEILHLITVVTAEMMGSKICSIMLLDADKAHLKIEATQSLSPEYREKPPVPVTGSVSGRALLAKEPIEVLRVVEDPEFRYPDIARKQGLASLLAVPLVLKDEAIGVLNVYTTTEHHFTEEERGTLMTVASQAAMAIENTKLMSEASAAKDALEARKTIERAKGVIMRRLSVDEDEAFALLRRQSMNTRRSVREVAEAVLLATELKLPQE